MSASQQWISLIEVNSRDQLDQAPKRLTKQKACAHFSSMYTKIGRIERRLAWPLHKDDMQMPESFHVKKKKRKKKIERGA